MRLRNKPGRRSAFQQSATKQQVVQCANHFHSTTTIGSLCQRFRNSDFLNYSRLWQRRRRGALFFQAAPKRGHDENSQGEMRNQGFVGHTSK